MISPKTIRRFHVAMIAGRGPPDNPEPEPSSRSENPIPGPKTMPSIKTLRMNQSPMATPPSHPDHSGLDPPVLPRRPFLDLCQALMRLIILSFRSGIDLCISHMKQFCNPILLGNPLIGCCKTFARDHDRRIFLFEFQRVKRRLGITRQSFGHLR